MPRMERKDHIDAFGAAALIGFALLLAFNQVVIKVTNGGLQPVFFAGLRSLGAIFCIYAWMRFRGIPLDFAPGTRWPGILAGLIFAAEFICLFTALDLTTVTRTSVIFYSMPVWLAIAAHFLLPGERITPRKGAGLILAFGGTAWAILDRGAGADGQASLLGDLAALGAAVGWASIALVARATRLKELRPEMQLMWQVAVSAPVLLIAALFFGELVRDLQPIHLLGLAFQIVVVVSAGFVFWFWLLRIYPAAGVASFSFLAPIFGVMLGWLMLDEPVGPVIFGSVALVAAGILLINWPDRPQVPQKV